MWIAFIVVTGVHMDDDTAQLRNRMHHQVLNFFRDCVRLGDGDVTVNGQLHFRMDRVADPSRPDQGDIDHTRRISDRRFGRGKYSRNRNHK